MERRNFLKHSSAWMATVYSSDLFAIALKRMQRSSFTLSYVDYATGGMSLTIPTTARSGDFCIAFNASWKLFGPTPTTVIPSGFTEMNTQSDSEHKWSFSCKQLAAGDPGTSITGMNSTSESISCYVFRPSRPATFSYSAMAFEATDNNPTAQTVPASIYS